MLRRADGRATKRTSAKREPSGSLSDAGLQGWNIKDRCIYNTGNILGDPEMDVKRRSPDGAILILAGSARRDRSQVRPFGFAQDRL
jgi:hypothetical protein